MIEKSEIRDRALGCFMGLAIGDALGAPVEFKARGTFPPVTGYRAGGAFSLNAGEWTDDTSMALALAWSLRVGRGLRPVDAMERWLAWRTMGEYSVNGRCFDIGARTDGALREFADGGRFAVPCEDALGNGGIMRMAPAAIWSAITGDVSVCVQQSALTHNSTPANLYAGRLGRDLVSLIWGKKIPVGKPNVIDANGGRVDHCYCLAMSAFWLSRDFKGSVLRAVNFGGDADSIGAVAGQLAGAHFGLQQIEDSGLLEGLADRDRLFAVANDLVDVAFEESVLW